MTNAQLWYMGSGVHELRALDKAEWLLNLSKTDNRRLAEWAVDRISLNNHLQDSLNRNGFGFESNAAHSYFDKLHQDYEQDLREHHFVQDPVISDEEAAAMLFEKQIEPLLEKIKTKVDVELG